MASDDPASALRAAFDGVTPLTVGLEEEVVLLDPETLDLAPVAADVLRDLDGRFKPELPAAQLELVTPPRATVAQAIDDLRDARRTLAAHAAGRVRPAALAVHPFAAASGALSRGERYEAIERRYGEVARRQLVCALQVHVAVGGAERTVAVHDALRSHLPLLAALAAAAPFYEGRDTGLASIRPSLGRLLPRQGVPPALGSLDEYAGALRAVGDPALWWWEVRPHPVHGTLELRVPDVQPWLADGAAVAATAHALVAWLSDRYDGGDLPSPEPTWRIEERRWLAARHGSEGPLEEELGRLLDALVPFADRVGAGAELAGARRLARRGAAARLRELGPRGAAMEAADAFD